MIFYGSPYTPKRLDSWNVLRNLQSRSDLPWTVIGDFNEVCFSWEVRGNRIRVEWQMRNFREAIQDCKLTDVGFKGNSFTFSNRRKGSMETKACLDRVLATHQWRTLFPFAQVTHIACTSSDHYSLNIVLSCAKSQTEEKIPNGAYVA